jgi:hypothetical protein
MDMKHAVVHINTLLVTHLCILALAQIIILDTFRTVASRNIAFGMKYEEEIDKN